MKPVKESDSESESEEDTARDETKQKVLANLWRRPTAKPNKRKTTAVRGRKPGPAKAKVSGMSQLL